jgi:hypothetical protein
MIRSKSAELFEKAKTLFPGGVNSPVRAFKAVGGTPLFIKKGKGAQIWDEDGNEFIDFCCSWGPLVLGHANDKVEQAIIETVKNGTSFGTTTDKENLLGDLIISINRFIEKISFIDNNINLWWSGNSNCTYIVMRSFDLANWEEASIGMRSLNSMNHYSENRDGLNIRSISSILGTNRNQSVFYKVVRKN